MNTILKKFPGFEKKWQEHLAWWGEDVPGLSNDMSSFSDYILELLQNDEHADELKEIFAFIEELMTDGSKEVQEAVATCCLENLINATSWDRISASSFVHLLGKESKEFCKGWDEFTGAKTAGLWADNDK